jgi:hypothetical protein
MLGDGLTQALACAGDDRGSAGEVHT